MDDDLDLSLRRVPRSLVRKIENKKSSLLKDPFGRDIIRKDGEREPILHESSGYHVVMLPATKPKFSPGFSQVGQIFGGTGIDGSCCQGGVQHLGKF